jgi:predicted RND superfamily exporter protein
MSPWVDFVLRHRLAVLLLWATLTGLAAWSASRAEMSTRLGEDMIGDRPEFKRYLERARTFRSDGAIIVGIDDDQMLLPDHLAQLQATVTGLQALPDVAHVESILSVSQVESRGRTLRVAPYVDEVRRHPEKAREVLTRMQADPLVGPLFIAANGKAHLVLVEFTVDDSRAGEDATWMVQDSLDVFLTAGYSRERLHVSGFTAALAESVAQLHFNVVTIFPVVSLVLLLAVWLLFGRLWPAVISLAVSMTAVIWTIGFLVAVEGKIHTLVSLTPPVILIVAFSDVVHLCSAYLMSLSQGRERMAAIKEAGGKVGKACLLTSATTFVGFASFGLIPQPAMRSTAIALSFGVAVALLIALTLVPILFTFGRTPSPLRKGTTGSVQAAMDRLLEGARRLAMTRPRTIIAGFALVTLSAGLGAPYFTFEADFYRRFDERNQLTRDTRWFKDHFAGTNMLEIYVRADGAEALLDPERLKGIAEFQQAIAALPSVDTATSLVDLFQQVHAAMAPEMARTDPLPTSRPLLAQYLLLFESARGEELDRIVDFQREEMVIGVRLNQDGARQSAAEGARIEAMAGDYLTSGTTAQASGLLYLLGYFFEEILEGQTRGLFVSFLLIALLMMVGLSSVRVGLLAMIPNLLPVLFLVGMLGAFWTHVDSDIIIILVVAVGIGVDDTIHFLTRFRIEVARQGTVSEAVKATFNYAGRGILMTTIILVAGFLPCALSSYVTMVYLGTLLPLALIVALLADVLLVPALIAVGLMTFAP